GTTLWSGRTMPKESLEKELEHILREDLLVACQYWSIDVTGKDSGSSLIKMLAERMRMPEERKRVFVTFSPLERDLLGILTLSGGAMSYDRLKPFRKIYSYGQLNQTERDLRKKGIIIRRMMSRLTEFGREVAEFKVLDFFIPHLRDLFEAKPEPNREEPKRAKNIENDRDSLLMDILLLVSYLAKRDVHLTSAWEFPRREIDSIKASMSKSTDERFELVQKMARKMGAYVVGEGDRVQPSKIDLLFSGGYHHVARRLLLSQLGRTRAIWATPDQPTEYTLNLAICRLRESSPDEWVSVEELRDWIRSELFIENQELKWIQVDDDRVQLSLETPILLGLVDAAYRGKKLLAVRLTDVGDIVLKGKPHKKAIGRDLFFVLPNFEVTVFSTEMEYHKLYRLMLITEPVRTDVVSTFKITDKSVFEAIEIGLQEDDILGFLEKESSKPIPQNVVRSITDWTSQATFTTVTDVTLFETQSEQDLEDLLLLPDFTRQIVRKVGPTAVIVTGNIEELSANLRKHKCMVRRKVEDDVVASSQDSLVAEQFLLFGEDQGVEDVPNQCEGCPAVPSCNKVIRKRSHAKRGV
ncbi:MAG: helicase-associated domain-containing protein, partial [Candidatus Thorarchaeota archaeon]